MKTIKTILLSIFTFSQIIVFGQNEKNEREPFELKLAVDTLNFYEQTIEKTQYFVKENVLQIYPGEKLYIEVETKKSTIVSMKSVKENLNPKKTIEIEFTQKTKARTHQQMMLKVKNPFKQKLKYEAMMFIVGQDQWLKTSIIPVEPKLLGYESWNDVIITLVLNNWQLK